MASKQPLVNDHIDLRHLQRIVAVLDSLPDDTDVRQAIRALEDAKTFCVVGLLPPGCSLQVLRDLVRKDLTLILTEHRAPGLTPPSAQGDGDPRPVHGMGAVEDDAPPDTERPGRRW